MGPRGRTSFSGGLKGYPVSLPSIFSFPTLFRAQGSRVYRVGDGRHPLSSSLHKEYWDL